jgi:hypothetical protein
VALRSRARPVEVEPVLEGASHGWPSATGTGRLR